MTKKIVLFFALTALLIAGYKWHWVNTQQVSPPSNSRYNSTIWYNGTIGYYDAKIAADNNNAPMLIYLYTDWCQYCRRLEDDVLSSKKFKETFSSFVKVKMNPERNSTAEGIMKITNSNAYPTMLFKRTKSERLLRVGFYEKISGKWVLRDINSVYSDLMVWQQL